MKYLKLIEIRIDGDTQPRVEINNELIEEYAADMRNQDNFPPLRVVVDGANYWLYDGFHRYHAAHKAGLVEFPAEVVSGTQETARWLSLNTNREHGLRRTNADKRKAVETALQMKPEMSDSALAQHCGVSHPFVGKIRNEISVINSNDLKPLQVNSQQQAQTESEQGNSTPVMDSSFPPPMPERRIGLDGKSYPAPPMSPPPVQKAMDTDGHGQALTNTDAGKPKKVVDSLGREIPEECIELWHRKPEVQVLLSALSKVRGAITAAQDSKDILFKGLDFSGTMVALDGAYRKIKTAIPYVVCPSCQGLGSCRVCSDRGLLSQFKWDTVVSQQTKDMIQKVIEEQD